MTVPVGTVPSWNGELRSGARANLLMNVTSARMDIKAAAARAERALERYAEPFAALHGTSWPQDFLDVAWTRVLENSAHDSVCGCSADPVSAQVLVRYAEAEQVAHELVREAFAGTCAETPRGAVVVANPSPFAAPRPDRGRRAPAGGVGSGLARARRRDARRRRSSSGTCRSSTARACGRGDPELLQRRSHGRELFGRWLNGFRDRRGPTLVLDLDTVQDPLWLDVAPVRSEIEAAAMAQADVEWEVIFRARPRRRLLARVRAPPLGWTAARAGGGRPRWSTRSKRTGARSTTA